MKLPEQCCGNCKWARNKQLTPTGRFVRGAAVSCAWPMPTAPPSARKFAIAAHGNQEYDGKPYRVHLDHVVEVLVRFGIRATPVLEAAWLHDVLEDTSVTADTLRERFGYGPARIVYAVTNEPGANRKERAIKTYPKIRWHGINAVVLKVADRIANTEYSIEHGPAKKLKMYREEFPAFSTALFASGECDSMWDYLRSISTEQPE